jgi:RNA polymerase sigma-70 factor (ECF subfamily)
LKALPDRQQTAIRLRHFEGLSNPDIAAALDVSVEAVESLLSRARRTLTAQLAAFERA